MELSAILEPVKENLEKVEDRLRSVSQVDFLQLSEMLDYSLRSTGKRIRPILTNPEDHFSWRVESVL